MLVLISCVTTPYSVPNVFKCTVMMNGCYCVKAINEEEFEVRELTRQECAGHIAVGTDDYQLLEEFYEEIIEELLICKEEN